MLMIMFLHLDARKMTIFQIFKRIKRNEGLQITKNIYNSTSVISNGQMDRRTDEVFKVHRKFHNMVGENCKIKQLGLSKKARWIG